jgi:hypothetical protein
MPASELAHRPVDDDFLRRYKSIGKVDLIDSLGLVHLKLSYVQPVHMHCDTSY